MCAHHFLGKDDKYVYLDLVCGSFKKSTKGEVIQSMAFKFPTRVEYNKNFQIIGFDQPVDGTHHFVTYNGFF